MEEATSPAPTIQDPADHADDDRAIRRVVQDVEDGFNRNDPDLSVKHFASNASVINAAGVRVSGLAALLESNRKGLAGFLKDEFARYEVDEVEFLRPDVALAYKRARATTPEGEPLTADPAMVALYVMVKEGDRWWIAARANVPTQSG